jgi:hypothetical protein
MTHEGIDDRAVAAKNCGEVFARVGMLLIEREQVAIALVKQSFDKRMVRFGKFGNVHGAIGSQQLKSLLEYQSQFALARSIVEGFPRIT